MKVNIKAELGSSTSVTVRNAAGTSPNVNEWKRNRTVQSEDSIFIALHLILI